MLVSTAQMQASEEAAFVRGIRVEALMALVGESIAKIVKQFYPHPGQLIIFGGKGGNTGDVLAAATLLVQQGWRAQFQGSFPETSLNALISHKLMEFRQATLTQDLHLPISNSALVVLDGLLGIGAKGPPRAEICAAIDRIDTLRRGGAWVLAADVPTGLHADSGLPNISCVKADLTASIGFVKKGLVADTATNYVGRLALVSLPELLLESSDDTAELIVPRLIAPWLPPRNFNSHKGLFGRVGILAGSRCYPGAARLCTYAALRAGAGIVILFLKEEEEILYSILATSLPPEAIIFPVRSFNEIFQQHLDVLCLGPGITEEDGVEELLEIVREAQVPAVIDAGALNIIARQPNILCECNGLRLLTPHPGEFSRLSPKLAKLPRRQAAEAFVSDYPVTLLLKGARAIVTEIDTPSLINSTGNPGMSSGGMGDAMTGVCGALLAQGLTPRQAASIGIWLCGRAAEIAIFSHGQSPQSLIAGDVIQLLGQAFCSLYRETY